MLTHLPFSPLCSSNTSLVNHSLDASPVAQALSASSPLIFYACNKKSPSNEELFLLARH